MSSASSLRNHRIVIASLFLPQTVVLGAPDEEYSDSPVGLEDPNGGNQSLSLDVPEVISKLSGRDRYPRSSHSGSSHSGSHHSRSMHAATPFTPAQTGRTPNPTTPGDYFGLTKASVPAPLKSIVEDLEHRHAHSTLPTPSKDALNPFSALTTPVPISTRTSSAGSGDKGVIGTATTALKTIGEKMMPSSISTKATSPPNASATHIQRSHTRRMRRQGSRSSSRRPGVTSSKSREHQHSPGVDGTPGEDDDNAFFFEPNAHVNGGLKNALDSVSREQPQTPTTTRRPGHSRANSLQSVSKLKDKLWVGTLGTKTDDFSEGLKRNIDAKLKLDHDCEAVWVSDEEFEGCYDEFCHQVLWPALHYAVPDAPKTRMFYESASYKQYVAVNKAFAERIAEVWQEGDIVWVNDYHLMLLPLMLRSSGLIPSNAPIGFFLHAAFPSSEIFRCLSVRSALLRGMLGADLVGFQTANFARHFRQTCSRILSVESLPRGIQLGSSYSPNYVTPPPFNRSMSSSSFMSTQVNDRGEKTNSNLSHLSSSKSYASITSSVGEDGKGRFVDVGVFPMGIDVNQLNERRKDPAVQEWIDILRQKYAGMKIVVGRDKMDEVQGVRQKIQAFERFLEQYASKDPELKEKVVLIQIAIPASGGQVEEDIGSSISTTVSHINSKFSTLTYQPIVFLHTQDVSFSQYLALLRVADAFLVTSLREGMALRTHEFVVCQEGKEKEGSLVLSEFTGSYSYSGFRSCIAVNPWDMRGTAAAINQSLTMSSEEAHSRWEDLQGHVIGQSAQAFVIGFLSRCLRASQEEEHSDDDEEGGRRELDVKKVISRWKHGKARLVAVDWEGGLVSEEQHLQEGEVNTEKVKRDEEETRAIEVLKALVKDPRNEVWLLSGYSRKQLARVGQEVGGRLGIIAENGCYIKTRNTKGQEGEWISMVANLNMTWKNVCSEMLHYFTERTPGSYVQEREASVIWRFCERADDYRPDSQWARRQAAEAQNHIFDSLGERFGLRIIPSSNSFLVLPNNISWSTAVGSVLLGLSGGTSEWDIVVAMSGDERLLRRLGELDNSETVSISGKGSTDAKWRLARGIHPLSGNQDGLGDVARVIREFAEC
ncbi:Trehalose-6-P synthase/phosphatase complex subunit [Marasmius sp. AFHP31]|nr:Trehalose-6-P synthase/phosphatase complex subunit [Marasmius sp. AFHP31]